MLRALTRRLLPLLQLTRMALVFTAIADSWCEIFLQTRLELGPGSSVFAGLQPLRMALIAAISTCLYAFGMSLNDIVDRRRDETLAATRPIPSGRINLLTAHLACTLLGLLSVLGGLAYALLFHDWPALLLIACTGALISFYDFAGKYLVAPGLIALGLIRFFHCLIPAPQVPLIWHPLFLFNHITILSAVAYLWEQKRPTLTRSHAIGILAGLAVVNLLSLGAVLLWHSPDQAPWLDPFPGLILPLLAAQLFVLLAVFLRWKHPTLQEAGKSLMFYGLLWLIIYDAAFAWSYVGYTPALVILALLPIAYLAVRLMRFWGKLVALSHVPEFQRAQP